MLFNRKKYNFINMIILYFKFTPLAAILNTFNFLISAALYSVNILAPAMFIDRAVSIVNKETDMSAIVLPIALLVGLSAYNYFIGIIMSLINCRAENKMRKIVDPVILEKKAKIKFRYYENQETMDVLTRATNGFKENITAIPGLITGFAGQVISIISFCVILSAQVWWASIVLLALCIPIFVIAYKSGKKMYDANKEMTKIDRKVGYFRDIMTSRDTIEERYTFGYTDRLTEDYRKDFEFARIYKKKVDKRRWIDMKSTSILVIIASVAIIGILLPGAVNKTISIGIFTSLAGNVLGLGNSMSWGLSWQMSNFKYKTEYLGDLNKFLEYEEIDEITSLPESPPLKLKSIEFRNVSFRYPGTEPYILKDMSFTLNAGKHYAIVGINGAGKTTITKLITGLYDEFEGEIFINGKDIRTYTQAELKSLTSVVYQDFSRYPVSFYDNIALGNINHMDDMESVENSVSLLGLNEALEKLPQKYDTPLTKIKETGVDMSGGEWQRVALARIVVNPAPLKILDEPTAALDPISESKIYEQFGNISNHYNNSDNTVIFISHRLGSTKLADEIIVISDGKVEESGTFDELMARNGLYAEMFTSQAEWYKDENDDKTDINVKGAVEYASI